MIKIPYLNNKTDPSVIFDAAPFLTPSVLLLSFLICYQISGNALLAPWLIYIGTPFYNLFILDDMTNLKKENERKFANSPMFIVPLYAMVATQSIAWIHGLFMFSDNFKEFKESNIMFNNRPETVLETVCYFIGLSFFAGLTSTAGHELVHYKAPIHKFVGNLPYVQFFYSHFW